MPVKSFAVTSEVFKIVPQRIIQTVGFLKSLSVLSLSGLSRSLKMKDLLSKTSESAAFVYGMNSSRMHWRSIK